MGLITAIAQGSENQVWAALVTASEDEVLQGVSKAAEMGRAPLLAHVLRRVTYGTLALKKVVATNALPAALLIGARASNADVVRQVLDYGADPNQRIVDKSGACDKMTLLHEATSAKSATIVAELLLHGADVEALDSCGKTAEDRARAGGAGPTLNEVLVGYWVRGIDFEHGQRGLTADVQRALALYDHACAAGTALGCHRAGLLFANGKLVPRDDSRAIAYLEKAAATTDSWALLGSIFERRGAAGDLAKARAAYEKGCPTNGDTCVTLGKMFAAGRSVQKDATLAAQYYEKGCGALTEGGRACAATANAYLRGEGRVQNIATADKFEREACDKDELDSCAKLAERLLAAHKSGEGKALAEKACASGGGYGCRVAGAAIADPATRKPFLDRGCDLGDAPSCRLVARTVPTPAVAASRCSSPSPSSSLQTARGTRFDTTHGDDVKARMQDKTRITQWFGMPHTQDAVVSAPLADNSQCVERWTWTYAPGGSKQVDSLVVDFDASGIVCVTTHILSCP